MARGNRLISLIRRGRGTSAAGDVVLTFPQRGLVRLERLASNLQRSVVECGADLSLFPLEIEPGPRPRLRIDETAVVEHDADRGVYQVIVEGSAVTRVTLETSDFADIERFVRLYIVGQFADLVQGALMR